MEGDLIEGYNTRPTFWYEHTKGQRQRYYPDIYLPSTKTIIEVKSRFTYGLAKERNNTKEQGYNSELWVYNPKGQRTDISLP
jgi:hypothetical protein